MEDHSAEEDDHSQVSDESEHDQFAAISNTNVEQGCIDDFDLLVGHTF